MICRSMNGKFVSLGPLVTTIRVGGGVSGGVPGVENPTVKSNRTNIRPYTKGSESRNQ